MVDCENASIVAKNTEVLAKNVGNSIEAMTGKSCVVNEDSLRNNCFLYSDIIVIVPFSGTIQGHYIMSMDTSVASFLLNCDDTKGLSDIFSDDCLGLFQEILNVASGQSVVELEKVYGVLNHFAPVSVNGKMLFPRVLTGCMEIGTSSGKIICGLMLDMVKAKITQVLNDVSINLELKTYEAVTDELTKVFNRRYFEESIRNEIEKALCGNKNLGLMMVDIDYFKHLNDTFGHQAGDGYLKSIAGIIKSFLSETDIPARYGGDEFVIVLPSRTPVECVIIAEQIRNSVKQLCSQMQFEDSSFQVNTTVSIGVTSYVPGDSCEDFLLRADKLLYSAKKSGRNTFVCG
jgi:diguanylate cyclase (GGDEF)-like protein